MLLKNPDSNGLIRRTDRIPDTIPGTSRFQQSVLHQGRIENYLFDFIERTSSTVSVMRPAKPLTIDVDESAVESEDAYPISVCVECLSHDQPDGTSSGQKKTKAAENEIRCKYLIGCDGAHSWVGRQIGLVMEGEQTESIWGVMDIVPITDFRKTRILFPLCRNAKSYFSS
jgi:phenol 2-monooxygenase (NADPH)